MNKLTLITSLILSANSFAFNSAAATNRNEILPANTSEIEYLQKEGLPLPDEGVVILNQKALHMPAEVKAKQQARLQQFMDLGYQNEEEPRAQELLNYKKIAKQQFIKFAHNNKPSDTKLRKFVSDIAFAYTFIGIPKSEIKESIGIAPLMSYIEHQGWTGGIQYFESKDAGICAYSEKNLLLTHGSSHVDQNLVKYFVNNKITLTNVRGNNTTGYLSGVWWVDREFDRTLECAKKTFSKDDLKKVIELAKKIDSYII